jgi:hypothetical protein
MTQASCYYHGQASNIVERRKVTKIRNEFARNTVEPAFEPLVSKGRLARWHLPRQKFDLILLFPVEDALTESQPEMYRTVNASHLWHRFQILNDLYLLQD